MKWSKLIVVAFLVLSCEKTPEEYNNLNGGRVDVVGHGGGGFQNFSNPFPGNSLESILSGLAQDADGIELDIQLSADSVLMLHHDVWLTESTDCDGCVIVHNQAELEACQYRQGLIPASSQQHLISLGTVLAELEEKNLYPEIYLDIRVTDLCPAVEITTYRSQLITRLVSAANNSGSQISVISRDLDLLEAITIQNSSIQCYAELQMTAGNLDLARAMGMHGVSTEDLNTDRSRIERAHALGLKVIVFGPFDQRSHAQSLNMHPDAIISDNIPLLRSMLD